MTQWKKESSIWLACALAICTVFGIFAFSGGLVLAQQEESKPWVAPDDAKKMKNPLMPTPENLSAGEDTFRDNCVLCHGEKGMGDGAGGKSLKVKPANFTDPKLMSTETDGSLFWKMSQGRGPMPAWKDTLEEKERWQLVLYIRKLGKDAAKK